MSRYDIVIVGGGSAGCALANRLSADPSTRVLVLEAGRPDYSWDVFIHMPAGLATPIGNRYYDWKYESEPEPHMNGRRIYHARGKVLGGSSSINGMIFQRGNPLDYERWGADAGHAGLGLRALPAVLQAHGNLPCRSRRVPGWWRATRARARSGDEPALPGVLRCRPAGRLSRSPTMSTATGRRDSLPSIATSTGRRRLSAARAYLHPVLHRPNLEVRCRSFVNRVLFDGTRATGVEVMGKVGPERIEAGEVILCGGAINSPQLLQVSGVGNARELEALGVEVVHDLPGVGEHLQDHLEVYIQYGSKQPVSVAPAMKWRNRPWVGIQVAVLPVGPRRDEPLRGRRVHPRRRRRGLPEPDVPLPARRDPLRRIVACGRPRLPGARRPDVLGRARLGQDHVEGSPGASRAAVQLSLDRAGPARVVGGRAIGTDDPDPARVRPVQRGRALTGAVRRDRRGDSRLGRARRGDGAPPIVHVQARRRRAVGASTPRRCGCTASRGSGSSTPPCSPT